MNLSNIEVSNNDDGITNLIIKSKNILINDEFINDFIESIDFFRVISFLAVIFLGVANLLIKSNYLNMRI